MSVARSDLEEENFRVFLLCSKKESLIANTCNSKSDIACIDKKDRMVYNNIIKMQRRHCCVRRTKIS